jgi:hypothetical protein
MDILTRKKIKFILDYPHNQKLTKMSSIAKSASIGKYLLCMCVATYNSYIDPIY